MSLACESFVLLSFKFLLRTTLHGTAVSFWSQAPFPCHGLPGLPWLTWLAACSSCLLIPPLLNPCVPIPVLLWNFLTGTHSHCPKALISSHNIHRKEKGSIFCCLFRYLVSYTGFVFRKTCDAWPWYIWKVLPGNSARHFVWYLYFLPLGHFLVVFFSPSGSLPFS